MGFISQLSLYEQGLYWVRWNLKGRIAMTLLTTRVGWGKLRWLSGHSRTLCMRAISRSTRCLCSSCGILKPWQLRWICSFARSRRGYVEHLQSTAASQILLPHLNTALRRSPTTQEPQPTSSMQRAEVQIVALRQPESPSKDCGFWPESGVSHIEYNTSC